MRQQLDFISAKNTFKRVLKLCSLMMLALCCFSGEKVHGDSTFFPEGSPEAKEDKTAKESPDAIKVWAELKPSKKETAAAVSSKEEANTEISFAQSQTPISELPEEQQPLPVAALNTAPKAPSSTEEQKPLKLTTVEPHPKAIPIPEKAQAKAQHVAPKTVVSYSDAANDRVPLGVLEPIHEIHNQKWYIYSSAIRGLKNPSDSVHIVSMEGTASKRGEEVKNLLVEMVLNQKKFNSSMRRGSRTNLESSISLLGSKNIEGF